MTEAERHLAFTSAVGWVQSQIAANGVLPTSAEVGQWIRNHGFAHWNVHASTALAIGTRAVESARLAQELWADEHRVPAIGQIPANVGIDADAPRFEYQVVIDTPDGSTRIDLQSDTPLSFAQAAALALAQLPQSGSLGAQAAAAYLGAFPDVQPDVHLVAVARR